MCLPCLAATNSFIVKFFSVANINTNAGTGNLTGNAAMVKTNSPFSIYSNAVLNVVSGKTQQVYVAMSTAASGRFTNWVLFTSNGGNSTNMVYGTVLPNGVADFRFLQ